MSVLSTLSFSFLPSFQWRSALKGKNLLSGANSLLKQETHFGMAAVS